MADGTDKTFRINIEATDNASSVISKVTAEQEALTNSGKGLATGVPTMEDAEKQEAYIIRTEAEYLAIKKTHDALTAKIPVMAAAGKSTEALVEAQKGLSAALSTNEALLIAEKVENKALAEAQLENAAAAGMSTTAIREFTVIARELERGNFSRLPGSISILAGQLDLMKYVLSAAGLGVIGLGTACYFLYEHLQTVNAELDKVAEHNAAADFLGNITGEVSALSDAASSAQGFADSLADIATNQDIINKKLKERLELYQAIERAEAGMVSAEKAAVIAKIQADEKAHRITPEQAAQEREAVERKFRQRAEQGHENAQDAELAAKQAALKEASDSQKGLEDQARSAAAKVAAEKDHEAAVKVEPKEQLEKIQKAQAAMDALQGQVDEIEAIKKRTEEVGVKFVQRPEEADTLQAYAIAKAQRDALQGGLNAYNATQTPAAATQRKADEDAAAEADRKAKENATFIENQKQQIGGLSSQIQATRPTERATAFAQPDAAAALKADAGTADAVRSGQGVSSGAAQRLIQDASTIAGHAVNLQDAATVIEYGANNIGAFMAQLSRLTAVFQKFDPARLQAVERQIDYIEQQNFNMLNSQTSG